MAIYHRMLHVPGGLAGECAILLLFIVIRPFGKGEEEDDSFEASGSGLQAVRSLAASKQETEELKRDPAEEGYAKVEEQLGGRAGIEKFAAKSQSLEKEIKRRMGKKEPWRQDNPDSELWNDG